MLYLVASSLALPEATSRVSSAHGYCSDDVRSNKASAHRVAWKAPALSAWARMAVRSCLVAQTAIFRPECPKRPWENLPEPSLCHDVDEKTASYSPNYISSVVLNSLENGQLLENGGCRGEAKKKDVKMKVYATMLLKINCRKIKRSRFATIS